MVHFSLPLEDWKIVSVGAETRLPAPLPALVKKQKDLEAELAQNQREARTWANDLSTYPKLEEVRAIEQKGGKVPPALVPIQQKWAGYQATDRDLKKKIGAAKSEVEREKRNAALSVGQVEGLEGLTGEVTTKDIELLLTTGGQQTPYVMTLRKYELTGGTDSRMVSRSRWVVQSLTPKG
jgi:hypothetical protein